MIPAGCIISTREKIAFAESELQAMYRLRDTFKFGSHHWCYHQQQIIRDLARLRFLQSKLAVFMEQPIPAGTWGEADW